MKKIIFRFSDYSGYKNENEGSIEEGQYVDIIKEKYHYDTSNKEQNKYFEILCEFVKKVNQGSVTEINLSKSNNEEDDDDKDSDYGNKISSKIMNINKNLDTGEINTKGYIGVLRGKVEVEGQENYDVTVEIGSRFDNENKQLFLRYLLSSIYKVNIYDEFNPKSDEKDSIWNWLLIVAFKYELENAYRSGLFKKYKRFEYNDSKVKGVVDVNRHIKYNIPFNGKISYNKRELTHDNEIMHLILHAYDILKRRFANETSSFINKTSKAYEAICAIREVAPNYKNENVQALIFKCYRRITHPYYHNYEPLRRICLLILKNKGMSLFDGESSDVVGIIVNISKLWERFLYDSVLKENDNAQIKYQYEINLEIKRGDSDKKSFTLKPDYVIEQEGKKYVLDAKYKIGWENFVYTSKIEYILGDYRQITNYVYLLNAQWGGVIFPYKKEDLSGYYFTYNDDKYFYLFGLKVPKYDEKQNADNWKKEFEKNIKELAENIYKSINDK